MKFGDILRQKREERCMTQCIEIPVPRAYQYHKKSITKYKSIETKSNSPRIGNGDRLKIVL